MDPLLIYLTITLVPAAPAFLARSAGGRFRPATGAVLAQRATAEPGHPRNRTSTTSLA